ncbi:hypothetical protein EJ02DRAFT_336189 [Clathrospora elynae]|uniref:Uncharacterized protein n=1 Tax=Clathrospora elynae TaxID=706981 RepID=A0A6A5T0B8_9PLEO|nr:hypothetical protein EJ02DRAFT_336189 [Clathrospora elynae]
MSLSAVSPTAEATSNIGSQTDPLVAQTAQRIANVINDFKRELDKRDGTWASATGTLELALQSQAFALAIVTDEDGEGYAITVRATSKPHDAANGIPHSAAVAPPAFKPTRRASDAELERDLVSRKKRKRDENGGSANKRALTDDDDDEDTMPLITKEDLDDLLARLREDVQGDTSECVNHVQRLLRRLREEWHEKNRWDCEQARLQQTPGPVRDSIPPGFPSPSVDRDEQNASIPDMIHREAKLISNQVRWVEDCRKMGADLHDKREETWRSSSAVFHDRQRQDREAFQTRILHDSSTHTQTLNHILNEVRAIGLYAQNMKWETPASHLTYPSPSVPTPPAFPAQSMQPARPTPQAPSPAGIAGGSGKERVRGRGRGRASYSAANPQ